MDSDQSRLSEVETSIDARNSMVEARKERNRKPIRSFLDLEVYQNTYQASILVLTEIIPRLPKYEQDDLGDQMKRSCKAVPRLIAEGYSKRHQARGFQKYLDDSLAESNEMIVCLSHCKDVYGKFMDLPLINCLLDAYDKSSRQIYNLSKAWRDFKMS